jgi:enamine deaminase RidA (YjgF/YER057c/UK114 family)
VQLDLKVSRLAVERIGGDGSFVGPATLVAATRTPTRVYLSAQQGGAAAGTGDVRAEVDTAYRRILAVAAAAGATPASLVETIEHVTHAGLDDYAETAEVRRELLPQPFTAATGTVCNAVDGPGCFTLYATAVVG